MDLDTVRPWSQSCLLDHGACAVTPQAMVAEATVPRSPQVPTVAARPLSLTLCAAIAQRATSDYASASLIRVVCHLDEIAVRIA